MSWEPIDISREDVTAKVLELASQAGYEEPGLSTPIEGSDPSNPNREIMNLYIDIEIEFKLWSPGEAFNTEKDAPFCFSDEELDGLTVIGDLIDPLGKYIRKSYDAHAAWERDGAPADWVPPVEPGPVPLRPAANEPQVDPVDPFAWLHHQLPRGDPDPLPAQQGLDVPAPEKPESEPSVESSPVPLRSTASKPQSNARKEAIKAWVIVRGIGFAGFVASIGYYIVESVAGPRQGNLAILPLFILGLWLGTKVFDD